MSAEPFSVQCLTCGSRLRVTDPAIVGTIAACPRCNSMVQIERPGNQVAVGASNVDSQAITEDAIDAPHEPEIADTDTSSSFSGTDSIAPSSDEQPGLASPLPPAFQSERTHRSRQIALVVAVSVSGLLAAVLFFSWFVRNWREQSPTVKIDSSDNPAASPLSVDTTAVEPTQDPTQPAQSSETDPIDSETAAGDRDSTVAIAPETAPVDRPPAAETIPTDLLPSSPIVANPIVETADQDPADGVGRLMELPPGLAEFTEILPQGGPIDLRPTREAPPALDEIDINAAAQEDLDPLLVGNPPAKINVKADLAIQMALDSDGYRLTDLALLFGQLTGVPIEIDWVSFDLAGIDIHERVQTPKTKLVPAKDLLDAIAASLGAEIQDHELYVVLTPSDATFDARLAELTTLDDFGQERDSAVRVLNQFLQGRDVTPAATLQVGPSREDKQFAILAVESLRRMRQLEPKLSDDLIRHWAQTAQNQTVDWPLLTGGASEPQRSMPISVAGLIRHTTRLNDSSCVVHWPDAIRRHLSPTQVQLPRGNRCRDDARPVAFGFRIAGASGRCASLVGRCGVNL